MQNLQTGCLVRARRQRWRVVRVRPYDGCQRVELAAAGPGDAAVSCELIAPFDRIEPVATPSAVPRRVRPRRWRRAVRSLIGRCGAPGVLTASGAADMTILPHQLEPAVAVLRGDGCRVLLADEVGLGKTVQASVLIAELLARNLADRVLVLTPPGLRDQWRDELSRRFHIDAAVADVRSIRRRTADLPPDASAWDTWPAVIASVDYVKRPEVLRAALNSRWDLVIVDEAHRVANDGSRRQAVSALASLAAYVVLLTATPHSGDEAAFQSLCSLGAHEDRLLIFRRTRRDVASSAGRRLHRLRVGSTADERRVRAALGAFDRAVRTERGDGNRDVWIALALLWKRAFSSARALLLTVTRRLDAIAGGAPPASQLRLPLDREGESIDDEAPAWDEVLALRDARQERRLLGALAAAARAAARHESKMAAIRRLLRRTREPLIIFTEYRDTLEGLADRIGEPAAVLHGGLSRAERLAALDAFSRGRTRVLLATDAAAEGLNLHHTCRAVVNLELPWNPMRLEQRIGRVDRIGQTRTVHAFHLVGRDTGELGLLDQLRRRIGQAQAAVGAPDPLDGALSAGDARPPASEAVDVSAEVTRLRLARALPARAVEEDRPLLSIARNPHTRIHLGARTLRLWECAIADGRGRIVSSYVVATLGELAHDRDVVARAAAGWEQAATTAGRRLAATGLARAAAVLAAIERGNRPPMQPGLFDRRAHVAYAALAAARDDARAWQAARLADLDLAAALTAEPPRLRLLLVPPP